MKKSLLNLLFIVLCFHFSWSQCIPTCSNYVASAIPFTVFPSAGINPIAQFAPNPDDGITPLIPIGFSFDFYCTNYTNLWICSNGFLQFNNGTPAVANGFADPTQAFPSTTAPNALVALNMNDLDPGSGGTITYTTIGTTPNQRFILTYSNVPIFGYPADLNTGQIVLYETSNIIEIYTGNVTNNSTTNGTQGIENSTGTLGTSSPGRNNVIWSASLSAYQFAPFTPAPPTAINGSTIICQGSQSSYSINAIASASLYNWVLPAGWNGSSTTTAITATAGFAGSVSVTATYSCGTSAPTTLSVNAIQAPIISIISVNPQGVICSGNNFTITPSGAINYTLSPGSVVTNSVFVINASNIGSFSITGADANCKAISPATTSIQINASPTIAVNSGSICDQQTFSITPTGAGADSYVVSGGFFNVTPPPGVYSFTIIGTNSANLCSSVPVVSNLTVNANPSITLTAASSIICKGESVKLTALGAATYSWNTGDITGIITPTPVVNTQYTVTGKSAAGCAKSKSVSIIVTPCAGLKQIDLNTHLVSVFPNPSNGLFRLIFDNSNEITSIEIFDLTGRLVLSYKTQDAEFDLNLFAQPSGLYYVKITNSLIQQSLKIIKE